MTRSRLLKVTFGLVAFAVLVGVFVVGSMLTGEYWCQDRSPWWGPPADPASTCTGLAWARDHPGDYPWNLPR